MITIADAPLKVPMWLDPPQNTRMHPTWLMWFELMTRVAQGKDLSAVNASSLNSHADTYFLAAANATPRRCGDGTNDNEQTITAGGALTLAHGLSSVSDATLICISVYLKCVTAEAGYSIGDLVSWNFATSASGNRGVTIVSDATNLNVRYGSDANTFQLLNKGTGSGSVLVNAKWKAIFVAKI